MEKHIKMVLLYICSLLEQLPDFKDLLELFIIQCFCQDFYKYNYTMNLQLLHN